MEERVVVRQNRESSTLSAELRLHDWCSPALSNSGAAAGCGGDWGLVWLGEQNQARLASQPRTASAHPRRLAPRVELYDQSSQLVKFERYLGRTRMVIVFFDGEKGADADPWLSQLRDHHAYVVAAGAQVIGIGMATPYANRQAVSARPSFRSRFCPILVATVLPRPTPPGAASTPTAEPF